MLIFNILIKQGESKQNLMLNEHVRNIMTMDPIVAESSQSIAQVTELMRVKKMQQLPVVKDGLLVGMITSYDLWQHSQGSNPDTQQKVSEIMSTRIIKIAPKDKVGTAAELFMDKRFKTLPVVNLRNELKGVVTAFDVIRHVMQREYQPSKTLYPEVIGDNMPTA